MGDAAVLAAPGIVPWTLTERDIFRRKPRGALDVAKADIEAWVDARFAGVTATSNCDEPPSAAVSR
jgi:hypothetical protein